MTVMSEFPVIRLKKNEDRRLRAGHLWVFSNEVDVGKTPLTGLAGGSLVNIENAQGESLGTAYVNPESLIAARILTRRAGAPIEKAFFKERFQRALRLREATYPAPFYRLVYGESDGLPGLVVDRVGDTLVIQSNTLGMENLLPNIVAALDALLKPRGILLKNTSSLRALEGLELRTEVLLGTVDDRIEIEENGSRFRIDPHNGQKTGWFFDHRDNRQAACRWASGRRVLDLFAYIGGWSVPLLKAGASEVLAVDASESAAELARQNVETNGVSDRFSMRTEDVFEALKTLREAREGFDMVIVDPPAFIKRRKDGNKGLEAYRRLNQGAIQLLRPGGILVSASCSFHLPAERHLDLLRASARHLDRHLVILGRGGQAADHPIHPATPETDYLKAWFAHVEKAL